MNTINIGDILTCAETGKTFTAEAQGCTLNYARNSVGEVFSDEGVNIREAREMLDRSKPFTGYLSCNGKTFGGWKGNVLGHVTRSSTVRLTRMSYTHGETMLAIRVRDVHGAQWYGRGSPGICVTLRPCA